MSATLRLAQRIIHRLKNNRTAALLSGIFADLSIRSSILNVATACIILLSGHVAFFKPFLDGRAVQSHKVWMVIPPLRLSRVVVVEVLTGLTRVLVCRIEGYLLFQFGLSVCCICSTILCFYS